MTLISELFADVPRIMQGSCSLIVRFENLQRTVIRALHISEAQRMRTMSRLLRKTLYTLCTILCAEAGRGSIRICNRVKKIRNCRKVFAN